MSDAQPTVLFVDDEPGILKSLRRLFIDEKWRILLADSGAAGLKILSAERVDLVVSDFRMPEMDGVEFLAQVKDLYPETTRIFLSGYADKESVTKALAEGYALQILPKPWDDDELGEVLRKALDKSQSLQPSSGSLTSVIDSLSNLPPLPKIYLELKRCLADRENFTIDQVVEIIRRDMSLAVDLLRWANSALFGQRRKVDTVKRAVMLLGVDIVETLILSESVSRSLNRAAAQSKAFDASGLQRHSMSCAILARLLVPPSMPNGADLADQAFIAGLLHDIGFLAEARLFHAQFERIDELIKQQNLSLVEAELQVLQTSHAEIGAILSERWSLPSFLVNVIRWHHEPFRATEDIDLTMIIASADLLANRFGHGLQYAQQLPDFEPDLLERCQLTPQRLEMLAQALADNLAENEKAVQP
jgi:HD-like signal output (HDOD) protein